MQRGGQRLNREDSERFYRRTVAPVRTRERGASSIKRARDEEDELSEGEWEQEWEDFHTPAGVCAEDSASESSHAEIGREWVRTIRTRRAEASVIDEHAGLGEHRERRLMLRAHVALTADNQRGAQQRDDEEEESESAENHRPDGVERPPSDARE